MEPESGEIRPAPVRCGFDEISQGGIERGAAGERPAGPRERVQRPRNVGALVDQRFVPYVAGRSGE